MFNLKLNFSSVCTSFVFISRIFSDLFFINTGNFLFSDVQNSLFCCRFFFSYVNLEIQISIRRFSVHLFYIGISEKHLNICFFSIFSICNDPLTTIRFSANCFNFYSAYVLKYDYFSDILRWFLWQFSDRSFSFFLFFSGKLLVWNYLPIGVYPFFLNVSSFLDFKLYFQWNIVCLHFHGIVPSLLFLFNFSSMELYVHWVVPDFLKNV